MLLAQPELLLDKWPTPSVWSLHDDPVHPHPNLLGLLVKRNRKPQPLTADRLRCTAVLPVLPCCMKQEKGEACITRSRVVWVHVKVKDTLPAHQKPELLRMIVVQPAEGSVPPGGSPTSRTVTSCNFASVCQTGKVGDFWSSLKPSRSRSDSWHKRSRIANAILCFTPKTDELTFNICRQTAQQYIDGIFINFAVQVVLAGRRSCNLAFNGQPPHVASTGGTAILSLALCADRAVRVRRQCTERPNVLLWNVSQSPSLRYPSRLRTSTCSS